MAKQKKTEPVRLRGESWYYRIKVPNKYGEWKWTERKGGKTKAECLKAYRLCKKELEALEYERNVVLPRQATVEQGFNAWFEEYVDINTRYSTQKSYHGMVNKHILPAFGNVPLRKMNARMLQKFINDKSHELKRSSLGKLLVVMQAAFRYAVNPCGFIDYSPAENLFLPREINNKPKEICVFSPEDLAAIEDRFDSSHHYYLAIHICLYTGLRIGEALGLRWQDINLDSHELSVCGTMTERGVWQEFPKTKGSFRTIPFGQKLHAMLIKERKRQSEASFAFQHGIYNYNNYVCVRLDSGYRISGADFRFFNEWCKTTLGHGSTHSFRHTHATMLLEAGESLEAVSKRLGHSSIVVTSKYYSHVTAEGNSKMSKTLDKLYPVTQEE